MHHRRLQAPTAAALALALLVPSAASAAEKTVIVGAGGHTSSGGVGSTGHAGFRYRFTERLALDVGGHVGHLVVPGRPTEHDQLFLGLAVGPTLTTGTRTSGWEGLAFLQVTHVHHASFSSWGRTPWSNLSGDSSGGVSHRSGLQAGLGVLGPALNDLGDGTTSIWQADLVGAVLPSSEPLAWSLGLRVSLGLRFAGD